MTGHEKGPVTGPFSLLWLLGGHDFAGPKSSTDTYLGGCLMRKVLVLVSIVALVGAALDAPVAAGRRKPVKTTLYMHGNEIIGEAENQIVSGYFLPMTAKKPTGSEPKSYGLYNAVATPNTNCAGNPFFPNWSGKLAGTVTGKMTVTFYYAGTPGNVDIRVWPDILATACNDAYVKESGKGRVMAVPGVNKVVLKKVKLKAIGSMLLQISPVNLLTEIGPAVVPPATGRVLYDSTSFATKVTFMCTPKRGKKCT
jgi:hypothetical protein